MNRLLAFVSFLLLVMPVAILVVKKMPDAKVVAELDGKPVTIGDLKEYVSMLPDKYAGMMKTESGLRKLAELYIQRQVILSEAKRTVGRREPVFTSHGRFSRDTAYIIAYLAKEVSRRVKVSENEIRRYMKEKKVTRQKAFAHILSEKRRKVFKELLNKLMERHKVRYFLGIEGE